jgi:multidrug efflux pump subunit AcrA (membrane-fusion protein)
VAALGRLEPAGDVRTLAAPSGGMGVSPRLSDLYVREGDQVRRGQVLASFDNRPGLLAQRQLLLTRITALETQLRQAGLDVGSNALSFQLSHGNAHRQNSAARNNGFSSALDDGQQPAEQVTSYVATRKRDGVDIHV